MLENGKIWVGVNEEKEHIVMFPQMANRHGLIAGATGTGKTVTLKVMAEAFSELGVPVFLADVKGDISGLMHAGEDSSDLQERKERFGLTDAGFVQKGFPSLFWDLYGKTGIPLRTTISEMGPLLLARLLELTTTQASILQIAFQIADDQSLLLTDTKDLKALLNYMIEEKETFSKQYGTYAPQSIGVIIRQVAALETEGADTFFGEPALDIHDFLTKTVDGREGMLHILDARALIAKPKMYSTFLLWFISELFETLPEEGDLDKPKMVFFFDEAHLLFRDIPKVLLEKIEQAVKLIRSKGIGIYFCTQNPADIPPQVLAQLSNRVEHGLRAYTPAEQKAVKAAAEAFRENPSFDTRTTILNLGVGEAVASFLGEDGIPQIAQKIKVLPPQSSFSAATEEDRLSAAKNSLLYQKYITPVDPDSAYEFLERMGLEKSKQQEEIEREKAARKQQEAEEKVRVAEEKRLEAQRQKAEEKARQAAEKELQKEKTAKDRANARAIKSVGNSAAGTIGRELGKAAGSSFGTFGKRLGGNVGASLARGILGTLFK
ncbi:MAG: DUF853 family protein [Lachnospiraceae bacterium]|nr:DUF853 family protein [Lachnospiraceae bacterium]